MVSRQAAIAFGVAAVMICLATCLLLNLVDTSGIGGFKRFLWDAAAVLGAFSVPFLWGGMTRFLEIVEQSRGKKAALMRMVLLLGVWYAAVAYYLFAYLPMRTKPWVGMGDTSDYSVAPPPLPPSVRTRNRNLGVFGYALCFGWGALGLLVICLFAFQNAYKLVKPIAPYFTLVPLALLVFTALYGLIRFTTGKP
jgi:hypothetical protein